MIQPAINGVIERLSNRIDFSLLAGDIIVSRNGVVEPHSDLHNSHTAIVRYVSALARLSSTLEDIEKIPRFGRRYAWQENLFSRSDHIRFVWMTFLHLAYVYYERTSIFLNQIEEASKYVALSHSINVGKELKSLKKTILEPYMQERGEAVHEWSHDRQEASLIGAMELMNRAGGNKDVKGHYLDARDSMLAIVQGVHRQLQEHLVDLAVRHEAALLQFVDAFQNFQALAQRDQLTVLNTRPAQIFSGKSFFNDHVEIMRRAEDADGGAASLQRKSRPNK